MSGQAENYPALAAALGLGYDRLNKVLYGQIRGYDILIYAADKKFPNMLTIQTSVRRSMELTGDEKRQFTEGLNQIAAINQQGNQIIVIQQDIDNQEQLRDSLAQSLNSFLDFLQAGNFQPCCSVCGQSVEAEPYLTSSGYMHLCPNCKTNPHGGPMAAAGQNKNENVVTGTVGALLGSLLGVLSIILLSRLGIVASISGAIMAVGVLKGYELLGGRLSKTGIVIGVVVMLLMTYLGDRLDWAIAIYNETDGLYSLFDSYRLIPTFLKIGALDMGNYLRNLAFIYLFVLLGAVPTIRDKARGKQTSDRMVKIGDINPYNYQK